MKNILNYFFRGLLFVFPVVATLYIIYAAVVWSNEIFNDLLVQWTGVDIPGLGIVAVFAAVSIIGFIFSRAFIRPIVNYFDRFMAKVPFIKIIYTSLRELTEAFVGDQKKFNKPVIADFSEGNSFSVKRIGFVTETDLSNLGLTDMVTVYCPHSYNFSGNLYILPAEAVSPVDLSSSDVMKYVISAGITKLES